MVASTLPGFYPHSEWANSVPGAYWGSISRPRSDIEWRTWVARVLPSNRRSLKDQRVTRSHPNKAVDVASSLAMKRLSALRVQEQI